MNPRSFRRTALTLGIAAATLIAWVPPAQAGPDDAPGNAAVTPISDASPVFSITDQLARQVATSLDDRGQLARIRSAVINRPVDLLTAVRGSALADTVAAANRSVLVAKGLASIDDSVLRLRLAHPDMRPALARGAVPLVAAAPTDDAPTSVVAYDPAGQHVVLDAMRLPQRPVLVVEVDVAKALPLGLEVMRTELAARGITGAASDAVTQISPESKTMATAASGYWATQVTAVRLGDDKEPWVKGGAEIYNLVAGFGLDGKVKVDLVQMPYLDNDGHTYYPNQLLVHFSSYKYNLADVVMMEDDGDTNYQALVSAIVNALLVIVDGGAYTPLVNAILNAIPTSWYTDDPDYVDSWYTLATYSSGRLYGAAGNGWLDVRPYFVSQF